MDVIAPGYENDATSPVDATPKRQPAAHWLWLIGFVGAVLICLSLPLQLPLGSSYWDVAVYLDAIQRIRVGQVPSLDFFAPVGPLSYYLAAGLHVLFPQAQSMLLVNWSILPVVLPFAVAILLQPGARERGLALMLPFLIFAALPINLQNLYPSPGLDGYGSYNRHAALLLYWLIAALILVEPRRPRTALIAGLMLALVLTKVTGAVAGAILVGYALLAGRMRLVDAISAALAVIAALVLIDLGTGVIRAYLADTLLLLQLNTGTLLPRVLRVASVKFNVILPASLLLALLVWIGWRERPGAIMARLSALSTSAAGWLAATLFALTLYETQNAGSLEYIGLWPVLLLIVEEWRRRKDTLQPAVIVLTLAVALPSLLICIERGSRALIGAAGHFVALPAAELGPLGRVNLKRDQAERAKAMLEIYASQQETYQIMTARGLEPSAILYSEIDYQATWLLEIRQAVDAIRAWEAREKRQLNGFFTLDFVDPINALLDRQPPRYVPIGIVPDRNLPDLSPRTINALAGTDAILLPKCPPTPAREEIARSFASALAGRQAVALSPCWVMYLSK